jgi:hypothetical protein
LPATPDPLSFEAIRSRAASAYLALELARWTIRYWDVIPPFQRASLSYALNGGRVGNAPVLFSVPLSTLAEALSHLRRHPQPEE